MIEQHQHTMMPNDLVAALHEAQQEILDLQKQLEEYQWVESALEKRTNELNERVKELECLHSITYYISKPRNALDETLDKIVNILPSGYRNPAKTYVWLKLSKKSYYSSPFQATPDSHAVDIMVHGLREGIIRVYVTRNTVSNSAKLPNYHIKNGTEPLILPPEKALLKTVAMWIGKIMESTYTPEPTAPAEGIKQYFRQLLK